MAPEELGPPIFRKTNLSKLGGKPTEEEVWEAVQTVAQYVQHGNSFSAPCMGPQGPALIVGGPIEKIPPLVTEGMERFRCAETDTDAPAEA